MNYAGPPQMGPPQPGPPGQAYPQPYQQPYIKQAVPASPIQAQWAIPVVRIQRDWQEQLRDWMVQTLGFAAAIVFGTWSILAYNEARQANVQSAQANALSLAAFCSQLDIYEESESQMVALCAQANDLLQSSLSGVAVSLFGALPPAPPATTTSEVLTTGTGAPSTSTSTAFPTTTSSSSSAFSSATGGGGSGGTPSGAQPGGAVLTGGMIVGIVVAAVVAIAALLGVLTFMVNRSMRRAVSNKEAPSYPGR